MKLMKHKCKMACLMFLFVVVLISAIAIIMSLDVNVAQKVSSELVRLR